MTPPNRRGMGKAPEGAIGMLWLNLVLGVAVLVLETSLGSATGSTVPISIPCQMIARSFDYEHRCAEHEHE